MRRGPGQTGERPSGPPHRRERRQQDDESAHSGDVERVGQPGGDVDADHRPGADEQPTRWAGDGPGHEDDRQEQNPRGPGHTVGARHHPGHADQKCGHQRPGDEAPL